MPDKHEIKDRLRWRDAAAIALLMTATLKIMANATISPALPVLEASFAGEAGAVYLTRFLVSAPSLTVVLVAPIAGLVADRYGKGLLLITGVLLFVVAGSAGAYLPDLISILASRLLLGVAVAMTMTAQVALVGDLFTGSRRSAFMGWQTAAINFSGLVFIGLAGFLAGQSPRLPFLVYTLPILLLPLLVAIQRQERQTGQESQHKNSIAVETGKAPHWIASAFSVGALTMVTVMLFFLMPSQLPYYLDENGFDSASGTALGLGTLMLTGGIVAMSFKHVSNRLGLAAVFGVGFTLMGSGFTVLMAQASWAFILSGAALVGAGYALVQPGFLLLALQIAPEHRRGSVSGIVTTAMFLGQVISPLLLTPFIQRFGFSAVFLGTASVLLLIAFGAGVVVLKRQLNHRYPGKIMSNSKSG